MTMTTHISEILTFTKECTKEAEKNHCQADQYGPNPKNEAIQTVIINTSTQIIAALREYDLVSAVNCFHIKACFL